MEKFRIDTEVRKLDQLRASQPAAQNLRQLRHLPREIAEARQTPSTSTPPSRDWKS